MTAAKYTLLYSSVFFKRLAFPNTCWTTLELESVTLTGRTTPSFAAPLTFRYPGLLFHLLEYTWYCIFQCFVLRYFKHHHILGPIILLNSSLNSHLPLIRCNSLIRRSLLCCVTVALQISFDCCLD